MKHLPYLLFFLFLLFNFSFVSAQPYDPAKVNKKAVQLYNQAMERAQDDNLTMAAGLLLKCIETDNKYLDAYLSLAGVYGQLKSYKSSVEYYEKAFTQDTAYTIEYKLPYSIQLAGLGEFEKALKAINELLDKKPPKNENGLKACQYRKRCYEFAAEYAKKNAGSNYVFAPKNLGSSVNTSESEYFPSLSIDGKQLVFTRRLNNYNEDFYYSKKKSGEWDKAKPMEGVKNDWDPCHPRGPTAQNPRLGGVGMNDQRSLPLQDEVNFPESEEIPPGTDGPGQAVDKQAGVVGSPGFFIQ